MFRWPPALFFLAQNRSVPIHLFRLKEERIDRVTLHKFNALVSTILNLGDVPILPI